MMARSFFTTVGGGFRNLFAWLISIFTWPFTLLAPRQRQSIAPTLAAMKAELQKPTEKPAAADTLNFRNDHIKDSVIAWSWANGCINDRQTRPMPSSLSRSMQEWLQGLNYTQLLKLKNAGPQGVFEHASRENVIAGIPPQGKLPAIEVRYPPAPVDDTSPRMIRTAAY